MPRSLARIAVVEDTPALMGMYKAALSQDGYEVTGLANGHDALDWLVSHDFDLLLLDLRLPDMDGLEILRNLKNRGRLIPVIVMTGYGSVNSAIDAMRHGARDFLVKPFTLERLRAAISAELSRNPQDTMPPQLPGLSAPLPPSDYGGFIGTSPAMQKVYDQIEAAAKSSAAVFITGESGTGKEVCARTIHKLGTRAGKPFSPSTAPPSRAS